MAFPTIVLAVATAMSSISNTMSKKRVLDGGSRFMTIIAGVMVSFLPFVVYSLFHGSLKDFYQNGILFNSQVYSNYAPSINFSEILKPVRSFLDIFDERWRYYLSPFFEWTTFEFLDNWVFAGFFFRLVIIIGSLALLIKRKFLGAVFVFLFGAMVLIRSETFFHASPFVFLSIFCASWLISKGYKTSDVIENAKRQDLSRTSFRAVINMRGSFAWMILILAFTWLNIRGGKFLLDRTSELGYAQNFEVIQGNAGFLKKATCGLDNARALIYPIDPIQYFFAEIPPSSKYHFMTPWVADVGQQQVISDLEMGAHLVYVNRGTNIWGHQVEEYLAELVAFLDERYIQIEPNYYASPELLLECPYER
jgi:hypothetical protein